MAMSAYTEEDLYQIFTDFGIKVTKHRLELLRHITRYKLPIPVIQMVEKMKKKSGMDQATVYRNLKVFSDTQVLNKVDINGVAYYELNIGESAIVIACSKCGALDRLQKVNIDDIVKKANKYSRKFTSLTHVNMRIYGICKSCER